MSRGTNKNSHRGRGQEKPKIQDAAGNSGRSSERNKGNREEIKFSPDTMPYSERNIFRLNDLYERGSI